MNNFASLVDFRSSRKFMKNISLIITNHSFYVFGFFSSATAKLKKRIRIVDPSKHQ